LRAQLSFEFFIALSFLILLFLVSLAIYEEERKSADALLSRMSAQSVAFDFSRAINGVHQCGDGCAYKLQLGEGYSLTVYGRMVEVLRDSQLGQAPLVTDSVELHSATPGSYILVVNNNGVVELHDV
jgi:hypothetical protein